MNVIRRHKWLAIISSLTLILVIVIFAIFAKMIFSNGDSEYREKLNGLVKVDQNLIKEIIKETKKQENVEDIEIIVKDGIVRSVIEYTAGTKKDKAIEIAEEILTKFDENIIKNYEFGYSLTENVEDNKETDEIETGFNIAGTKHVDNDKISWTK